MSACHHVFLTCQYAHQMFVHLTMRHLFLHSQTYWYLLRMQFPLYECGMGSIFPRPLNSFILIHSAFCPYVFLILEVKLWVNCYIPLWLLKQYSLEKNIKYKFVSCLYLELLLFFFCISYFGSSIKLEFLTFWSQHIPLAKFVFLQN